jgi:hypothetical protein
MRYRPRTTDDGVGNFMIADDALLSDETDVVRFPSLYEWPIPAPDDLIGHIIIEILLLSRDQLLSPICEL